MLTSDGEYSGPDSSESGGVGRPAKLLYVSPRARGLLGLVDLAEVVVGRPEDAVEDKLECRNTGIG